MFLLEESARLFGSQMFFEFAGGSKRKRSSVPALALFEIKGGLSIA